MRVVDLELALRSHGAGYAADARLAHPGSQADAVLVADAPIALDPAALLPLALDLAAYGRTLTAQLFADPQLCDAWQRARALADGADAALRLPAAAGALRALRWETLRDPMTDVPLATDARLRLLRFLDSPDTRPITLRPRPELCVLLVVAKPATFSPRSSSSPPMPMRAGKRPARRPWSSPITFGHWRGGWSRGSAPIRKGIRPYARVQG